MMTEATFLFHVQKNQDKLYRFAKRLLNNATAAEDAVQDLTAKLWRKKDNLTKYENLDVVMMVAMKNHCFDELKKLKRRRNHYQLHTSESKQVTNSPERVTMHKDALKTVKDLVNELPETQKMVIQLRDIEQLEYNEIQEITGLSASAMRTNLSRARKTIREQMQKIQNYGLE